MMAFLHIISVAFFGIWHNDTMGLGVGGLVACDGVVDMTSFKFEEMF
jgi:hypothetical protein